MKNFELKKWKQHIYCTLCESLEAHLLAFSYYTLIRIIVSWKKENPQILNLLAVNVPSTLHNRIGGFSVSGEEIFTYTVLKWQNIIRIQEMLINKRNSEEWSETQFYSYAEPLMLKK